MTSKARWHLGQLDSLRGIAVLNVLLVHAVFWAPDHILHPGPLTPVFLAGKRGVQLFFIVSAFTLCMSHEKRLSEVNATAKFFIRRFFRITPMFWVACILGAFLWPQAVGTWGDRALAMSYLAFLSPTAINHGTVGGWSIANEVAFYCLLPLLSRWITSLRSSLVWLAAVYVSLLTLTTYLARVDAVRAEFWTFLSFLAEFPIFLLGIVAFHVWKEYLRDNDWSLSDRRTVSAAFGAMAAILYWRMLPISNATLFTDSLVCLFLLLALLVHPWAFISNAATRFLGKVSFSVYLLHFYVIHWLERWITALAEHHAWLRSDSVQVVAIYVGGLLCVTPIAWLAWKYIEEPGSGLGRRMIRTLDNRRVNTSLALET